MTRVLFALVVAIVVVASLVVLASLVVAGCDAPTGTAPPEATPIASGPPMGLLETEAPAPVDPPTAAPPTPCAVAVAVAPGLLAVAWPRLVGQRVRLSARVDRAVDLTEALASAGGTRFVVTASPEALWSGVQEHTFMVMGSTTVSLHGRTVLPHLLLVDRCAP